MKTTKRPLVSAFVLLLVGAIVYYMTSSPAALSLGPASRINLAKDQYALVLDPYEPTSLDTDNQPVQHEVPPTQPVLQNPDVIKRPKTGKGAQKDTNTDPYEEETFHIQPVDSMPVADFTETPFMPKMANETLKAQLGNAAWRLFHTILARYPDKPSQQEQTTLNQYIHLFAQVYPCGDCARHFQQLLQKYPPQTASRKNAALWGCHVHNKVNDRLGKPEYDCTTILEDYDCGCGSDEKEEDNTLGNDSLGNLRKIKVSEKEPTQRGG